MKTIYLLTLRQLSSRWRILIMLVLGALPVLVTLLTLRSRQAPSVAEFESVVFNGMLAGSIAPLVVLAIATAAFANELEDRTLANLTLAPVARWRIVVPKLLGAITIAAPFIAASALLTSHMAFLGDARATLAMTAGSLVGVALYSSAFLWLGLVSSQAIGIGLLYIVLWEGFLSRLVAGVRIFSVRQYAIALAHGFDGRRFADAADMGLTSAIIVSAAVFTIFLLLTIRKLRRMDVP